MLQTTGRTLYLAMSAHAFTGIFSSPEKALPFPHDELIEIEPMLLEGSPASEKYVCMIYGTQTDQQCDDDTSSATLCNLPLYWALNPQSAAAALYEPDFDRNIKVRFFGLFEIDHDYTNDELQSLHEEYPFKGLVSSLLDAQAVTEDILKTSYINLYFSEQRLIPQFLKTEKLPELDRLSLWLIDVGCRAANPRGRTSFCGFYLDGIQKTLKTTLRRNFSPQEQKQLLVVRRAYYYRIPYDELLDELSLSREEASDLLKRAGRCIPHVMGVDYSKYFDD